MEDLIISILSSFGYPVILQGSLSPGEEYPTHFFTFWNDASDGTGFFDNCEGAIVWQYSINFYSVDPIAVNQKIIEAKNLLKAAGFIVSGAGYSIMSDEPTHTGRGITVYYRQNNVN